ncbi:helix-turn-helix domain containing protein [Gilliamella sp. B2865]|uniref:helix-turn-helix transcriptional regulator n=1 Tax=Gilliamella sp. B2865 TaxID=2817984 RepID=UPI002269A166|nr:helix-turn-helix transcriptional regulator [Gilliamella sp. B2865]MCX8678584.1 helix-turn-helix domain containing protein [Gilliamella sp. B2865]
MKYDSNIRNVIERIMIAYNVKTIKGIADLMNVSSSVIGNRIHRDSFPHDLVLTCILDTGVNPKWLCTGEGDPKIDGIKIDKKSIQLSVDDLEKLERIGALMKDNLITESEYQLLKNSIFSK